MSQLYNEPGTTASTIGTQFRTDHVIKQALIELVKEQYFGQLADVTAMPKSMGKTIKRHHYMPMLDDRNTNDQGIDAAGVTLTTAEYEVIAPNLVNSPAIVEALEASFAAAHLEGDIVYITNSTQYVLLTADTAIGYTAATTGGTTGTEKSFAEIKAYIEADTLGVTATVANAVITLDSTSMRFPTLAAATLAVNTIAGAYSIQQAGNLYGSSKDIGYISSKLPALGETGGRVNRVGFKRIDLEGSIEKFGFFDEYTQESLDFDDDAELNMHITREMLRGANELTEDALQIDLLNGAGVIWYAGIATSNATITGVTADTVSEVDYDDFMRLAIQLDNNRCPKMTKIITGSRMIDTKVVNAARIMYIGSEMQPTIEKMTDHFSSQAFIPVAQYADAGTLLNGEIGTIGSFRVVVVPEMMSWLGAGAIEGTNAGYRVTNGRYDVYPMLVVGSESFTTIGFQTDGKTVKFKIYHKKPGLDVADKDDPFGETGFMSIKWYYGSMILRGERLALMKSVARQ
jgi:N4-gp56 family major capsid protein